MHVKHAPLFLLLPNHPVVEIVVWVTISTYIAILLPISLLYRCKSSVRVSGIYAFRRHVTEFSFTLPTNSTAVDALGFRRRLSKSHFIHGTTASVRSVSSDFSSSSFCSPFRLPTSLFSLLFSVSTPSPHSSSFSIFVPSRFSHFPSLSFSRFLSRVYDR